MNKIKSFMKKHQKALAFVGGASALTASALGCAYLYSNASKRLNESIGVINGVLHIGTSVLGICDRTVKTGETAVMDLDWTGDGSTIVNIYAKVKK